MLMQVLFQSSAALLGKLEPGARWRVDKDLKRCEAWKFFLFWSFGHYLLLSVVAGQWLDWGRCPLRALSSSSSSCSSSSSSLSLPWA